ncbi:FecR family protein [Novosphingobium terrae]|uniref:FecR family protein n=1 Tax=Novosphingobium terrae TaxID=2726189 RepID=UPI0019821E4E|nr:FecR domain-containing protein [Novosphingobium terrae]
MISPDSPNGIEEQALAWAVRHPLEAGDEQELQIWLAQDRRHRGALIRALAAWSMLDRAHVVQPSDWSQLPSRLPHDSNISDMAIEPPRLRFRKFDRRIVLGALGGGLAASAAGLLFPSFVARHLETTGLGEVRRLPLQDGSLATINTDSTIRVALAKDMRKIDLVHGEAWFDVAKDPARPFVVNAGPIQVRAVGTAFSVRKSDEMALVSVTEGVVSAWAGEQSDGHVLIKAGEQARLGASGLIGAVDTAPERIERTLAWRDGEISLRGETLVEAIDEFNRYNGLKIVVNDPLVGREKLVGLFQTNDPEHFAETVAATYNLEILRSGDELLLSAK